ncbi:MAG: hypothetical protein WC856_00010 [Methylococcaceae bacterium]|jgi:hypothetical protein
MVVQFFRECQGVPDQPGNPLPYCGIEAFDRVRQTGVLGHPDMLFFWDNTQIRIIKVGIKGSVLPVNVRYFPPKLPGTLFAKVADMEQGDDMSRFGIQSDP